MSCVDICTDNLKEAVEEADLLIFCTPLGQMCELARLVAAHIKKGAIVTDVGSVKECVSSELEPVFAEAGAFFVGSHPMAGGEKTGVLAAKADLFQKAICVVCSTSNTNPDAAEKVKQFWLDLNTQVLVMSPQEHDLLVSRSSHLPHLLAASLSSFVLADDHGEEQRLLCATGFRDTTRIASGSPEMWRDIAICNKKNILTSVENYIEHLKTFACALDEENEAALLAFFKDAKNRRDGWKLPASTISSE